MSQPPSIPFLRKSASPSQTSHYEAYLQIEMQLSRMQTLIRTSLVLNDDDKAVIRQHCMELHEWLSQNEKIVMLEFNIDATKLYRDCIVELI